MVFIFLYARMVALPPREFKAGEQGYLEEIQKAEGAARALEVDLQTAMLSALDICRNATEALMHAGHVDGKQFGLLSSLQQQEEPNNRTLVELQETHRKAVFAIIDRAIDDASSLLQQQLSTDGVTAILQMRLVQSHARLLATIHAMEGTTEGIILTQQLRMIAELLRYLGS